jgi:hypothetical protein
MIDTMKTYSTKNYLHQHQILLIMTCIVKPFTTKHFLSLHNINLDNITSKTISGVLNQLMYTCLTYIVN